jgi:multidrug efflux pump subunit AcrB
MQKLAEICVRRPVFATMLVMAMTVVGAFSFFTLGVDRYPNIDLPIVSIITANPGAAPEQVETEITDLVEGAVNTISGIDDLRSTSIEGISQVSISFDLDTWTSPRRKSATSSTRSWRSCPKRPKRPSFRSSIPTRRPSSSTP